jgi:Glycosyl transferases group 1
MRILLIHSARIPVFAYGGTERMIWDLGYELVKLGHQVTYLVGEGSTCGFAKIVIMDKQRPLQDQIPADIDIVHFQGVPDFNADTDFHKPYVMTEHGNAATGITTRYLNTIFISKNHASRHNSDQYVYNGLNWDTYGPVDFDCPRPHFHFLGKASWDAKNVRGAINVACDAKVTMAVLGGTRLNISRGFRLTLSPRIHFYGMGGGQQKHRLLNASLGHIFPVRWHEPFGLAMIESLYFGCPVYGTPYGTLSELVQPDVGYLSNSRRELAEAVKSRRFDPRRCHDYARDVFNSAQMAKGYEAKYEAVLNGHKLNAVQPYLIDKSTALLPWLD